MSKPNFADRYAEAGLSPTSQTITDRGESVKRIVALAKATKTRVLELVGIYYEMPDVDMAWFRDEVAKEDASFSLVNSAREARILAAIVLEELIDAGNSTAILSVTTGSVAGMVRPSQGEWLIGVAKGALARYSVSNRAPKAVETSITTLALNKGLGEEIGLVAGGEWDKLVDALGKIRGEAHSLTKSSGTQTSAALGELNRQMRIMREESQILWWLYGEHSRNLQRGFVTMEPQQAALVGALDLATLTNVSTLGPIAAPAILERVIALAKKTRGQVSRPLSATMESLSPEDLNRFDVPTTVPTRLAPITTAIDLVRTLGPGAWHARFTTLTGLEASLNIEPLVLSEQLYREHLLGQLL